MVNSCRVHKHLLGWIGRLIWDEEDVELLTEGLETTYFIYSRAESDFFIHFLKEIHEPEKVKGFQLDDAGKFPNLAEPPKFGEERFWEEAPDTIFVESAISRCLSIFWTRTLLIEFNSQSNLFQNNDKLILKVRQGVWENVSFLFFQPIQEYTIDDLHTLFELKLGLNDEKAQIASSTSSFTSILDQFIWDKFL